ncbi:MAG TPA: hypothetical protein VJS85_06895 [Rhizomicrobium sp.]|nr:hypothetical protein [Rhizomicrobium sp.]
MRFLAGFALGLSVSVPLVPINATATPIEDELSKNLGTMWVKSYPSFRDGRLNSCDLEFRVMAIDRIYKQGVYMVVDGAVSVLANEKGAGVLLKVVVNDIDGTTGAFTPNAPASAYFIHDLSTTKDALLNSLPSDTPGGYFSIFKASPTFDYVMDGIARNRISVAFARKAGGLDLQFDIDPTVVKTDSNGKPVKSYEPVETFQACNEQMLGNAMKAIKK